MNPPMKDPSDKMDILRMEKNGLFCLIHFKEERMPMLPTHELESHLARNKEKLVGDWIKNNSSYDGDIC